MTLDLKKDREIVQAALESQPIFKDDGPSALLYSEWARKQQYCSRTFNPAHALEYIETVEKQARAIEGLKSKLREIQLYVNGPHARNDNHPTVISCKVNEAFSQAREILGQAVSGEKGDE